MDSYQKFGPYVETNDATHTQRVWKVVIYIIDNSGEQSKLLKQALNGLSKQGKETGLSLSWLEGGSERVCAQSGACMV